MMDAPEMFPEGFHPLMQHANPESNGPSKPLTRTQCPPKYYFIDFGIARQYNPANGPPREWPIEGGDKTVPEFKNIKGMYDPFPTDVYYLGNFIREHFMTVVIFIILLSSILIYMHRATHLYLISEAGMGLHS
jgi:hypothetical protein